MQERYAVWQVASLLVGLYGTHAIGYANIRRGERIAEGDHVGMETRDRIMSKIRELLNGSPAQIH
ncbi:MAG TPA: hypothetical protein ENH15_03380 [Actinobacteria bacterium]|nr:hypothetical protein [Actinomycetota bacterium]